MKKLTYACHYKKNNINFLYINHIWFEHITHIPTWQYITIIQYIQTEIIMILWDDMNAFERTVDGRFAGQDDDDEL